MGWTIVDDFGDDTAGSATCDLLGTLKQPGDIGVFRGRLIDGEGFMDLSCQAIADAASMLDWIPPEKAAQLQQQVDNAEAAAEDLREQLRILSGIQELLGEALDRFPEAVTKPRKAVKKAAKKK